MTASIRLAGTLASHQSGDDSIAFSGSAGALASEAASAGGVVHPLGLGFGSPAVAGKGSELAGAWTKGGLKVRPIIAGGGTGAGGTGAGATGVGGAASGCAADGGIGGTGAGGTGAGGTGAGATGRGGLCVGNGGKGLGDAGCGSAGGSGAGGRGGGGL